MPSRTERSSTSSGTIVSIIDPSMGDVFERPYMRKSLRSTPISSAAPHEFANIGPFDPLGLLPQQRHKRKERRHDKRRRDHRHRMDIPRQHDVIERKVHRPYHVADQQCQMGFPVVHARAVSRQRGKNSAAHPKQRAAESPDAPPRSQPRSCRVQKERGGRPMSTPSSSVPEQNYFSSSFLAAASMALFRAARPAMSPSVVFSTEALIFFTVDFVASAAARFSAFSAATASRRASS